MAENPTPEFEHSGLERDIEELEAEIRGRLENRGIERGALKESLHKRIYGVLPPTKEEAQGIKEAASPSLPSYMKDASEEDKLKVEKLIDLAWHKGIDAAVAQARKQGAFILDAFHDALTDKLFNEFKARGLIK